MNTYKTIQTISTLIALVGFIIIIGGAILGGEFELFTQSTYVTFAKPVGVATFFALAVSYVMAVSQD